MQSDIFIEHNIARLARGYGVSITSRQEQVFHLYLGELWTWNRRKNLIGLTDPHKIVTELLLDSLIPIPYLPSQGKLLDVGSGAGFPALPLKICLPDLEVHLLEPNRKKVSFLKQIIRLAELSGIQVIQSRLENEKEKIKNEAYDLITSRAFTNLPQTIAWCGPLLAPGSRLVCFLGPQGAEDLEKTAPDLARQTLQIEKFLPYLLPGKTQKRHAVVFCKNPSPESNESFLEKLIL